MPDGPNGIAMVATPASIVPIGSLSALLQQTVASLAQILIPDNGWLGTPGKAGNPVQIIDVTDELATEDQQVIWVQYQGVRFICKHRFSRDFVDIFPVNYSFDERLKFTEGDDPNEPPKEA